MVMDFSFLKACMVEAIYDPCDHGLILRNDDLMLHKFCHVVDHGAGEELSREEGVKLLTLPYSPTAENLAMYWHAQLAIAINNFFRNRNEEAPELAFIDVWETPNCVARFPYGR